MDAVFDGRVVEEQKDVDGIGVGIDEDLFPEHLEGCGTFLAKIGDDAVRDFKAVDIGLVFKVAAVRIACGVCGESKKCDENAKRGKGGPVSDFADPPISGASCE